MRNDRLDRNGRKAKATGAVMTVVFHLLLLAVFFTSGLKAVYPPPPEQGILIEFEEPGPEPIEVEIGVEPKQPDPEPEEDIRLVQKSEAALAGSEAVSGAETTLGEDGDAETYEAPREKPIDMRAIFPSANNARDTLAAQTAEVITEALKAGDPKGNTETGSTDGKPSAKLEGRSSVGSLPLPEYAVKNKSGKVVVKILVDQYGTVTNAIPGVEGTTVQDKVLWDAAKEAAMKAKFNVSSSAPLMQEGTITYIFEFNKGR